MVSSHDEPGLDEALILEDQARTRMDAGDVDGALMLARRALEIDASRSGACEVAVDVCMQTGRFTEGIALMQDVVEAQPEQVWPYALLAEICAAVRPEDGDVAAEALNVASLPDSTQAADAVRQLLRRADQWEGLARHLEHEMGRSLHIRQQIAMHEELSDLHAVRFQDHEKAREIRSRGEIWRDVPGLVQTYWQGLEVDADQPEVWDEAEHFFRSNHLYEDLARLLEHSLLGAGPEEMVDRFQDLVEVYRKIPDADWEHLASLLREAVSAAPKPFVGRLREHLAEVDAAVVRKRKRDAGEPTAALATNLPPTLVFAAAAAIGTFIAAYLILHYLA